MSVSFWDDNMLGRSPSITRVLLWWSYRRLCSMRSTVEAIVCPLLENSQNVL